MHDNSAKNCVVCNAEKSIDNFCNKNRECKTCNIKRDLKRYYNFEYSITQQRRYKYACFKESDNRLKTLEEKLSVKNNTS